MRSTPSSNGIERKADNSSKNPFGIRPNLAYSLFRESEKARWSGGGESDSDQSVVKDLKPLGIIILLSSNGGLVNRVSPQFLRAHTTDM